MGRTRGSLGNSDIWMNKTSVGVPFSLIRQAWSLRDHFKLRCSSLNTQRSVRRFLIESDSSLTLHSFSVLKCKALRRGYHILVCCNTRNLVVKLCLILRRLPTSEVRSLGISSNDLLQGLGLLLYRQLPFLSNVLGGSTLSQNTLCSTTRRYKEIISNRISHRLGSLRL